MLLSDQINYWAKLADRPLTKFEQLVVARPFKFDAYFHTWNRMLKPVWAGQPHGLVEVSLSPVNGWYEYDPDSARALFYKDSNENKARELAEIRIRNHSTTPDARDKFVSSVPDNVRQILVDRLGYEQAQYLLFGNIFEHIDWNKYRNAYAYNRGGGVPLAQCHINSNDSTVLHKD